ncbi:UPF0146 family protein [Natronobeatus ordinarius]|uniref:UPF0146 family protein n=1 Tax=Natronobeatus ordinarius TaxID=2963433 RepID=UPI0020CCFEF3|nr:UPF0146 family protein [Natronobeatus ordinarius]
MTRFRRSLEATIEYLLGYDHVLEVGIGRRTGVASGLVERGGTVTATDVYPRDVPAGVRFVEDDVVDPDLAVYEDADVLFARNLPPELHRPVRDVARQVDADCCFTTLGGDQPAVPVKRVTIPGDTLYVARASRR